mgnify:FL=1
MITRPLKLAAHLRAEPRNFDVLFVVNAGLLALFFTLFGSRFVLSTSLPVDFQVPTMAGGSGRSSSGSREVVITLDTAGLMYVSEGKLSNVGELRAWLKKQSERKPGEKLRPSLQILANARVSLGDFTGLMSEAKLAGFEEIRSPVTESEPVSAARKP